MKIRSRMKSEKGMKGAITVWGVDEDDEDTFFYRKQNHRKIIRPKRFHRKMFNGEFNSICYVVAIFFNNLEVYFLQKHYFTEINFIIVK